MTSDRTFDYVIIGAGSAGCTLANRLTEAGDATVLLLEAGGWDRDPWISIPLGWGKLLMNRLHDWMYFAEPEATMNGRRVECARGKVIGGSSSINAMAYVRGHRGDYERWAADGLADWSYEQVLPYFRKQESWSGGADFYRGGDGPLTTQPTRYEDPLSDAYADAGSQAGFGRTADYNGARQEGFGAWQMTIRNGRRCSAAVAYLRPALRRPALTVETGALVSRVLLEGSRAVGVEYLQGGATQSVRAAREVILCGGVINSPQVLMLSGIGDPAALQAQGIEPRIPLPGVGRNLQDHISAAIGYRRKSPGPLHTKMRADRIAVELGRAYFLGTGIASDLPGGVMAFLKSEEATALPDTQILFNAGSMVAAPYLRPFRQPFTDSFASRAVLLRPESRGHVALASADPRAAVRIHQNFLATDKDWRTLRASMRLIREIGRQKALAPFVEAEMPRLDTDEAIDAHIRATAITVHHPLGTCKMGAAPETGAVVDSALRVHGAEGLRVVDASVMPDLIGGNINAPIIMIAERAADMIHGRALLPPVTSSATAPHSAGR